MDLFFYEARHRLDADDVLTKIDGLMDWCRFEPILERGLQRTHLGRTGYAPIVLFKCLLLGQWHGLSDPSLEKALKLRLDFMIFCGLDLHTPVPDHSTHCRFRNALLRNNVYDELLSEVCYQLETHGLKVKEAKAAIIDATLIKSAARPNKYLEVCEIAEDSEESVAEAKEEVKVHYSADASARWVKKGTQSTFGYKGFSRCDEEGFIDKVHTTPANKGESPEFARMIDGSKAHRIMADKAYASKKNREMLKDNYRDGILYKAAIGRPLRASQKRFNRLVSSCRFRIEQCFGTMKRLFGLARARYFGRDKTHAQLVLAAIGQNLLKAANKINLDTKNSAIA